MRSTIAALTILACLSGGAAAAPIARWGEVVPATETILGVAMGAGDADVILARRLDGDPLRTVDGGRTWLSFTVRGGRPDRFIGSPSDASLFYALTGGVARDGYTGPGTSALHRSRDAGASWELVSGALIGPGGETLGNVSVGAAPDLLFALRMVEWDCMVGCQYDGKGAFVSTDGGRTWRSIDAGLDLNEIYPAASDANVVYAKAARGLYRSLDQGRSWTRIRETSLTASVGQIVVDRRDALTVYVRPWGFTHLWVTEDGGATWRDAPAVNVPGSVNLLAADPLSAGRLFFIGYEGQVFESRDRARTWSRAAPAADVAIVGPSRRHKDHAPVVGARESTTVLVSGRAAGMRRAEIGDNAFFLGSDLWWNPAEPGSGWSLTQHATGQVFGVWYTYDAQGAPTWYVMPGGTWESERRFRATLYSTRGPAFFEGAGFDPSQVQVNAAGSVAWTFVDDSNATLSFELPGARGETRLTRQLFGSPNDWALQNVADLWWNARESGWGLGVAQQWGKVFATLFVYDAQGRPTWFVLPDSAYGYDISGPFQGLHRLSGDLYATRGTPLGAPYDPSRFQVTKVGTASVSYGAMPTPVAEVVLRYSAFGRSEARFLTRQPF